MFLLFIADGLLLGKVIPKVFFINVRDRVMRRRKKYGHTFSKMPKNFGSKFRLFFVLSLKFGFESNFLDVQ